MSVCSSCTPRCGCAKTQGQRQAPPCAPAPCLPPCLDRPGEFPVASSLTLQQTAYVSGRNSHTHLDPAAWKIVCAVNCTFSQQTIGHVFCNPGLYLVSFSVLVNDSYDEGTSLSFFNVTDFCSQNSLQISSGNPIVFPAPPAVGTIPVVLSAVGTLFTTSPLISLQNLGVYYASDVEGEVENPFVFTLNLRQLG